MPLWRCSGIWSQNLPTITCASNAGPARPRGMGRLGARAWKMDSHWVQASFGRTVRMTLKRPGTYSKWCDTSAPRLRRRPPQAVQPQAWPCASWCAVVVSGRITCCSRGRCSGRLRSSVPALAAGGAGLRAASSSSTPGSRRLACGSSMRSQSVAVLAEHRVVPHCVVDGKAHEPAEMSCSGPISYVGDRAHLLQALPRQPEHESVELCSGQRGGCLGALSHARPHEAALVQPARRAP